METETKIIKPSLTHILEKDYDSIINSSPNTVVIESEWSRSGDYFQKFSMYDNTYTSVPTLEGTTLISTI